VVVRRAARYRAEDIWDTPDDGNRYEVIDGDLYVTPPPVVAHQRSGGALYFYIRGYLVQYPIGEVFVAPIGVRLDGRNGLQPDVVYVSNARRHIVTEREIEGAPDLVVEVLSPSTRARDRGIKFRRYAAAGVPHYWIVAPEAHTLEAYALVDGGYALRGTYGPGAVFRPVLFPGLEIPIDALWA
jgi:Uma2 family endonuclease